MLAIVLIIVGLSMLILGHEAGHFFAAKLFKLKIDEFGFGFPPRIFAWRPFDKTPGKKGEIEYSLNWLPFGGFVKIAGENDHLTEGEEAPHTSAEEKKRLFSYQPAWKRSIVMLAGVFMNFVLGWIFISIVLLVGTPSAVVITGVQDGSPAAIAGLKSGDVIKAFSTADSFIQSIEASKGKEMEILVIRGGKELSLSATPRMAHGENEGFLGVTFAEGGAPPQSFFVAIGSAFTSSLKIFWLTVVGLFELLRTLVMHGKLMEDVVGPVGIISVAERTSEIGLAYLLQLIALISINLSVVNLLPFPALDGGRFFMICVEKIKGSPISQKAESAINTAGFAFLILLMIVITVRDIVNL